MNNFESFQVLLLSVIFGTTMLLSYFAGKESGKKEVERDFKEGNYPYNN